MRQFTTAARRGTPALPNITEVAFEFEVRDGEFATLIAIPPTSGQMAMMVMQTASPKMSERLRGVFDFLAAVLSDADYKIIEEQLHRGMDVEVLTDIVDFLIGEWSGRPTQPPSDSAPSPQSTGRRSTAKRPAAASTT